MNFSREEREGTFEKKDAERSCEMQSVPTTDSSKLVMTEPLGNSPRNEILSRNDSMAPAIGHGNGRVETTIVKFPDSSRELLAVQNPADSAHYGIPAPAAASPQETIITVANDEASVRAKNNSVIVVNISTNPVRQRDRDFSQIEKSNVAGQSTQPLSERFAVKDVSPQVAKSQVTPPSRRKAATKWPRNTDAVVPASSQFFDNTSPPQGDHATADKPLLTKPLNGQSLSFSSSTNLTKNNEVQKLSTKGTEFVCPEPIDSGTGSAKSKCDPANESQKNLEWNKCSSEQDPEQQIDLEQREGTARERVAPNNESKPNTVPKNSLPRTSSAPREESLMRLNESGSIPENNDFNGDARFERKQSHHGNLTSERRQLDDDAESIPKEEKSTTYRFSKSGIKSSLPTAVQKSSIDRRRVTLMPPSGTSTSSHTDTDADFKRDLKQVASAIDTKKQDSEDEDLAPARQQAAVTMPTAASTITKKK
ncbi:unnamed protein product, partial [Gongylonema pulchrum]|uniref:BRCT domain-containing protein n=1 Tax=Gongylonema pulchrum TaxID=637853 RepID=A0A183DF83_9BILA